MVAFLEARALCVVTLFLADAEPSTDCAESWGECFRLLRDAAFLRATCHDACLTVAMPKLEGGVEAAYRAHLVHLNLWYWHVYELDGADQSL